jgi:UDP-N-acetylglucosamine 2-epimerase (non-hydrolysing)
MWKQDCVRSTGLCRKKSIGVVIDRLADFLFTPSEGGDVNLAHEGVPGERIFRVGNLMIDSLVRLLPGAMQCPKNGFPERYALVTLHRPSNVDDSTTLKSILQSLLEINEDLAVVFPLGRGFSRASPNPSTN